MAVEQLTSLASTTLSGSILDTDTTLVVASTTRFPTTGNFRILIDTEIILVTAVAGTTFTITRAQEGTTAAGHADTTPIAHIMTAEHLNVRRGDDCIYGSIGSRPTAGSTGRLFIPSGGMVIQRDNGAGWDSFGPIHKFKQPPVASTFAWVNQGDATITDQGGILRLYTPQQGSDQARIQKIAAPGTPYTITAAFKFIAAFSGSAIRWGLVWRDSGSGKLVTFNLASFDNSSEMPLFIVGTKWDSATSTNSDYYAKLFWCNVDCVWLRITDDGTNRTCYLSSDGVNFVQVHQVGRTDWITADEVGFFVDPVRSTNVFMDPEMHVLSWEQT